MSHWKTILAYDGSGFNGWQIQPRLRTVQGTLSRAIQDVTGETVLPQGSGRTDAGVHALGQVASFTIDAPIPASNLHRALNRALPPSIRILSLASAPENFHARHSATGKTYEYRIFPARPVPETPITRPLPEICPPMLAPYVWDCPMPLDIAALQNAAAAVRGTYDFTSFAASDPDAATRAVSRKGHPELAQSMNIRSIDESSWQLRDGLIVYRVRGNGFLHHMVRNLVGTFVEAGTGRIPADSISTILAARNRCAAGPTAPARGLFLMEVFYEER